MYAFESTELKQREIPVCFRESVTLNMPLTIATSIVLKAIGPSTRCLRNNRYVNKIYDTILDNNWFRSTHRIKRVEERFIDHGYADNKFWGLVLL